jgi:hypothetical protein
MDYQEETLNETETKLERFGDGEWIDEPDRIDFEHRGINCLILRNGFGALCGYCQIPEGHKYHGKDPDNIPYEVHGGLTFAGAFERIASMDYWIGFDCNHSQDLTPSVEVMKKTVEKCILRRRQHLEIEMVNILLKANEIKRPSTYKNIDYVAAECRKLAEQIANDQGKKKQKK